METKNQNFVLYLSKIALGGIMEASLVDITYKRLVELEKRMNIYFDQYKTKNELDFILCGGYILDSELDCILDGSYSVEV